MASGTDVARAAKAAGFPDHELVTAVAIAYAESSFNENASVREPDGSYSYGLWQINSVHGFAELTAASGAWRNPATNAQLAKRVWDGSGWGAWSVYKPSGGAGYARFLAARPAAVGFVAAAVGPAAAAAGAGGTGLELFEGAADDVADAASLAAEIAKEPLAILRWLTRPDTWVRIAYVIGGGALVIGGLFLFVRAATESVAAPIVKDFIGAKTKVAAAAAGKGGSK